MKQFAIYIIFYMFLTLEAGYASEPYWELVSMSPPRGTVLDIAYSDGLIYSASEGGIHYSMDLGLNWIKIDNARSTHIAVLNKIIYARRIIKLIDGNYYWGFYSSNDYGISWLEIKPDTSSNLTSFKLSLLNNKLSIIYRENYTTLRFYSLNESNNNLILDGNIDENEHIPGINDCVKNDNIILLNVQTLNGAFLYISKDTCKSWKKYSFPFYIYEIKIFNDSTYFISTDDGIKCSTNYGDTWFSKWFAGNRIYSFSFTEDLKNIFVNIVTDNNTYSTGLFYSNDSGYTWQVSSEFISYPASQRDISKILIVDKNVFVSPQYTGIFKSEDLGITFSEINKGYSASAPLGFFFSEKDIYYSNWGIFKSSNNGKSFDYLNLKNLDTGPFAFNSKADIFVVDKAIGNTMKGILRSTDNGMSWISLFSSVPPNSFLINNRDVLFSATLGNVDRSTDNGNTWEVIYPPLASTLGTNDEGDIFTFNWIDGDVPGEGIWRSTDNGLTWDSLCGVGQGTIDGTIIEKDGQVVFNNKTKSAWYGPLFNSDYTFWGISKTTDNGRTWVLINYRYTDVKWYPDSKEVAVDSLGCWVAKRDGEKFGIYRSCDNGITWNRLDTTGLKHKEFGPIGVSPDGYIYVFGATGGLYRSRDKFVSVEEKPKPSYEIVSPNPAYDFIEVQNPNYEKVTILNILGEIIYKSSETNRIDISSFPQGIYLIRVGDRVSKFVKL